MHQVCVIRKTLILKSLQAGGPLENFQVEKLMTAISESGLEIKGNKILEWIYS